MIQYFAYSLSKSKWMAGDIRIAVIIHVPPSVVSFRIITNGQMDVLIIFKNLIFSVKRKMHISWCTGGIEYAYNRLYSRSLNLSCYCFIKSWYPTLTWLLATKCNASDFLLQLSSSQSQPFMSKLSLIKCSLRVVWRCIYSLASKGCHVYELC